MSFSEAGVYALNNINEDLDIIIDYSSNLKQSTTMFHDWEYRCEDSSGIFAEFSGTTFKLYNDHRDDNGNNIVILGPMNVYYDKQIVYLYNDNNEKTDIKLGYFSDDGKRFYLYNFLDENNPETIQHTFIVAFE